MTDVLMTVKEAAAWFRVSPRLVYRWIKEEGLPHYRTSNGRKIIIDRDEAMAWWRQRREDMAALSAGISLETRNEIEQFLGLRKAS